MQNEFLGRSAVVDGSYEVNEFSNYCHLLKLLLFFMSIYYALLKFYIFCYKKTFTNK